MASQSGQVRYAILRTHHVVFDNQSLQTMLGEVATFLKGAGQALATPVPYRLHVVQALRHAREHEHESFFRHKLGDVEDPTTPFGLLDVLGEAGPGAVPVGD